ncbi:MAG: gas vesicle protein [Anaerolineae bacterium]
MQAQSVLVPTREKKATLVDLLDRVLEKGLVIQADIIISVAGIPLIGINLRAALAGMETMLKYGLMREWDVRTRQWEREHIKKREPALLPEEEILLRMYGAHWYSNGIYRAWQPGHLYLTERRLFLFRAEPGEMLFETRFERIKGLAVRRDTHFTGAERDMLYLVRNPDRLAYLYAERSGELVAAIEERMQALGLPLDRDPHIPPLDPEVDAFLGQEEITADGKMWHRVPPSGIMGETWRPGWLYLTPERLCWWCTEERKVLFEVPLTEITGASIETMDLGGLIKERPVLCLSYQNSHGEGTALFAGDNLAEWQAALSRFVEERETCPQCGCPAPIRQLLEQGCPTCDWVSPRRRQLVASNQ